MLLTENKLKIKHIATQNNIDGKHLGNPVCRMFDFNVPFQLSNKF